MFPRIFLWIFHCSIGIPGKRTKRKLCAKEPRMVGLALLSSASLVKASLLPLVIQIMPEHVKPAAE